MRAALAEKEAQAVVPPCVCKADASSPLCVCAMKADASSSSCFCPRRLALEAIRDLQDRIAFKAKEQKVLREQCHEAFVQLNTHVQQM